MPTTEPSLHAKPLSPAQEIETQPAHPDTAGEHLVLRVLRASPSDTVGAVRQRLAEGVEVDSAEAVYLLEGQQLGYGTKTAWNVAR